MYDPTWSVDKVLVTVGMLVTALAWPVREALRSDDAGARTADDTRPAHP